MVTLLAQAVGVREWSSETVHHDPAVHAYARTVLRAFPDAGRAPAGAIDRPPAATPTLAEPLSPRELEVLRLIAAGKSNPEIAAALLVAVSTVKAHIHSIFGKLGVTSRTQALARARALHIA